MSRQRSQCHWWRQRWRARGHREVIWPWLCVVRWGWAIHTAAGSQTVWGRREFLQSALCSWGGYYPEPLGSGYDPKHRQREMWWSRGVQLIDAYFIWTETFLGPCHICLLFNKKSKMFCYKLFSAVMAYNDFVQHDFHLMFPLCLLMFVCLSLTTKKPLSSISIKLSHFLKQLDNVAFSQHYLQRGKCCRCWRLFSVTD